MKKLLAFLLQPPIPQLVGLLLLSAIIWFGGRALRPWLSLGDGALLTIVAAVWVLAALLFVWRRFRAGQRARLIEDRLRGQAREHIESVRPDKRSQVEELEKQLGTALSSLKKSKLGKGALYELPWYVIIGPPGSGKTTLLRESNLSFPDEAHGRAGVRGMGGTRNCDWWFTDQGILLDTAGRYTTQDEDKGEWLKFLDMLKKARSKKPINGAMIAISMADVVRASPEELGEHARKIRERLAELTSRLEVVFPVYLLFSKCDLLDGFVEMFGGYGKQERAQLWGMTVPFGGGGGETGSLKQRFDAEFSALHARLCAERLRNLGQAKSQAKKAKIFSFPMQFALVRDKVRQLLEQIDQPNPYSESSDIRGLYFTSGTQEGQPLDQVLAGMREACGLTPDDEGDTQESVDKKAYFIDDLFAEVVFPDKELARSSASAEKRRLLVRRVGIGATIAATVALMIVLIASYAGYRAEIEDSIDAYAAVEGWRPDAQTLAEEERLASQNGGRLEELRKMFVELDASYRTLGSYVMGQTNALYEERVRKRYVELLRDAFLSRLQEQLEQSMRAAVDAGGEGHDVYRLTDDIIAYRMLAGDDPVDVEWLDEKFLRVYDLWRWRDSDAELPACQKHQATFVELVARPEWRDWQFRAPKRKLLADAERLRDGQNPMLVQFQQQVEDAQLDDNVGWQDLLRECPGADRMDPSAGIAQVFAEGANIDTELVARGARIDEENGGEKILETKRLLERKAWKQALADMRPTPRSNLETAMDDVVLLVGEDGSQCLYLRAYELVAAKLSELGVPCETGDTGWLTTLLVDIAGLRETVEAITLVPVTRRVVPMAKDANKRQPLEDLANRLQQLKTRVPRDVKDNNVPAALRLDLTQALLSLVESLEAAFAYEIVNETNNEWTNGDFGKRLRKWSRQFPFLQRAEPGVELQAVSVKEFEAVMREGGEFAAADGWIAFLEKLIPSGFGAATDEFKRDRRFVADVTQSLFGNGDTPDKALYTTECTLQKVGDMTRATLTVQETTFDTIGNKKGELAWRPRQPAVVAIVDFKGQDGNQLDSRIDRAGEWGLPMLLTLAEVEAFSRQDVDYWKCSWSAFPDKQGVPLEYDGQRAEVLLYIRRRAGWDPFDPDGGLQHTFSEKVFRAIER